MNQEMNNQEPVMNTEPVVNEQPVVNQVPTQEPQPVVNLAPVAETPKKGNKKVLIIVLLLVVVAGVVVFLFLGKGKENSTSSKEKKEKVYVDGKIPYGKEVYEYADPNIKYIDNTRTLNCGYSGEGFVTVENYEATIYLNTDNTKALSYSLRADSKFQYNFLNALRDETGKHYLYAFRRINKGDIMVITSPETTKSGLLDFTNPEDVTIGNMKLQKGIYAKSTAYRYVVKDSAVEYAIIFMPDVAKNEEIPDLINQAKSFFTPDNGKAFLMDCLIQSESIANALRPKSYEYIYDIDFGVEKYIGSEPSRYDYTVNLKNNDVIYSGDVSYFKGFSYTSLKNNQVTEPVSVYGTEIFASYDQEYDSLSIVVVHKGDFENIYVDNYDKEKGYDYYVSNFIEMMVGDES